MKRKDLLIELEQDLMKMPDYCFDYAHFFNDDYELERWKHGNYIPDCGTTACVAGHCVLKWGLTKSKDKGHERDCVDDVAAEFLGLTEDESFFLFIREASYASKDDAIARLRWVIEDKDVYDYDFTTESWHEED